jgi:hypothetical protein
METDFSKLKFMPYRSYMGWADDVLGVDMFWYEKILIFVMYLQRLALLTMFNIPWPFFFLENSRYLFSFLLDFTAHHGGVAALGEGTIFEGCDIGCKTMWGLFAVVALVSWSLVAAWDRFSLYHTINIERILWGVIQIAFLPFCNVVLRYYMLNKEGRLYGGIGEWSTPLSEIGVVLLILLVCTFFGIGYFRMSRLVLFISKIRHESYLRSREVEYLLHFSPTYRNERVWMISHYNLEAWWWSLARCGVDLCILICLVVFSEKAAIVLAAVLIGGAIITMIFFVDVHRCVSSNWLEIVANCALFIYALLASLQVFGVQNALLVDNVLAQIILGIHVGSIVICLLMCLYFYIDGHTFRWYATVADKRAEKKWKKYFSPEAIKQQEETRMLMTIKQGIAEAQDDKKAGKTDYNPYGLDEEELNLHSPTVGREEEDFIKALRRMDAIKLRQQMKEREKDLENNLSVSEQESRKAAETLEDKLLGIDAASRHTWPMNESIVGELMRRNSTDHLVDYLRAARKLLDRISILHDSPMLVPTDEIKMHISRLEKSVHQCKLERITHHANIIHPLQPTFEELIEQLTYELRIFSKKSVTQGHNARKMIEVSRFLRLKMDQRENNLALLSPQMRRILLKMFALRIFIQLVFDRDEALLPKKYNPGAELHGADGRKKKRGGRRRKSRTDADEFYSDEDGSDYDSDDDDDDGDMRSKLHSYDDPFAADAKENFGEGVNVLDTFRREEGEDLQDEQDEMDMTHQMQLADMLRKKKAGGGGGGDATISAYDKERNNSNSDSNAVQNLRQRAATNTGRQNSNTGMPSAAAFAGDDDEDGDWGDLKKNR